MKKCTDQKYRNFSLLIVLVTLFLAEPIFSQRVTTGLQALYTFLENGGPTVTDVSGVAPQLNLTINTPGAITWTPTGLIVNSNASIISAAAATKIATAVTGSNEVTVEAWIIPSELTYPPAGLPARIVSMSDGILMRNVTLGQGAGAGTDLYDVRCRTPISGLNGQFPSTSTAPGLVTLTQSHVVYTFKAGFGKIYINGVLVKTQFIGGDLSNWAATYKLMIANETSLDREWHGEYNLVAVYGIALDAAQVDTNFNAGVPGGPTITQQPADQTVFEGQSATFNVAATGNGPFTYQWQLNNVNIGGATLDSFVVVSTTLAMNGDQYRCIVTDINTLSTTSNNATLNVNKTPEVTQDPTDKTVFKGQSATFKITAVGIGPLTYQWQKNGGDLGGATDDSLVMNPPLLADSGSTYRCIVTDIGAVNEDTSASATLNVNDSPVITLQPVNQTVSQGQSATFVVAATGAVPLTYQWQKNGSDIGGAVDDSLVINPAMLADSGSAYRCIVTDFIGNKDTSIAAILHVNPSPVITQDPTDQTVFVGETATFFVVANGVPALSYQWVKNGVDSLGTNSDTLNFGPVAFADSGCTFVCIVTDGVGNKDTSAAAILHVNPTPVITQQPADKTIFEGETAEFTVAVTGASPFSYQWIKNGIDSVGTDSDTLNYGPVVLADSGCTFMCIVTDSLGNKDTSSAATLHVNRSPQITVQPIDQTVTPPQTATFSVTAIGVPTLTYQWKKNGTIIPGATDTSYTTGPTALADSGDVYTCCVTDGGARSDTSTGAVLHVVGISWTGLLEVEAFGTGQIDSLKFGQAPSATDTIDIGLGEEELPPPPPPEIFAARFTLPDLVSQSMYDFRNSNFNLIQWRLVIQPGLPGWPVEIRWYPSQFPAGRFTLKDPVTGFIIRIDMKTDSVYVYDGGALPFPFLIIEYRNEICLDVDVTTGWNLLGVPLLAEFMHKDSVFQNNTADAFWYLSGYVSKDTLEIAKGYWMKFAAAETVSICGTVPNGTTIPVVNGWNLISPYNLIVPVASITTTPPGLITSFYFGFSTIYITADSLKPGYGYWVKANGPGEINLSPVIPKGAPRYVYSQPQPSSEWGKLIIEDAKSNQKILYIAQGKGNKQLFELPPAPPTGIFDVRYADDREVIKSDEVGDLLVNWAEYPITIRSEGVTVQIKDKIDGSIINKIVNGDTKLVVTNNLLKQFEVSQVELPLEYELAQNYPNPFNPSTTIKFTIPQAGKVQLYIYNLLGEKVDELVNKDLDLGYHEVEFNAAKYASGIYFYKLNAGSFSAVKKMMLLK